LLFNNIVNFFYNYTFIVSQIINTNIYLEYLLFNTIFNYFKYLKKIIRINIYFLIDIILKTCNKILTKFVKYYSKTKELDIILYNFVKF